MADRPILFSAPMVRALLEGRKTQTRRILKIPTKVQRVHPQMGGWEATTVGGGASFTIARDGSRVPAPERAAIWHQTTGYTIVPKWQKGDRLWCRETWRCNGWASDVATIFYRASENDGYTAMCEQWPVADHKPLRVESKWATSLHMPRWASRLTLTVTDVRVERLQAISEADCLAEGAPADRYMLYGLGDPLDGVMVAETGQPHLKMTPRNWYRELWDTINGAGGWDANPWVMAMSFTPERRNIDA